MFPGGAEHNPFLMWQTVCAVYMLGFNKNQIRLASAGQGHSSSSYGSSVSLSSFPTAAAKLQPTREISLCLRCSCFHSPPVSLFISHAFCSTPTRSTACGGKQKIGQLEATARRFITLSPGFVHTNIHKVHSAARGGFFSHGSHNSFSLVSSLLDVSHISVGLT